MIARFSFSIGYFHRERLAFVPLFAIIAIGCDFGGDFIPFDGAHPMNL